VYIIGCDFTAPLHVSLKLLVTYIIRCVTSMHHSNVFDRMSYVCGQI